MYKELKNLIKNAEEKQISEAEMVEAVKNIVLKKAEQYKDIKPEILEKGIKDAFRTGLSVLGLIHGAQYMGNFDPKLEDVKSRTPAAIEKPAEQKMGRPRFEEEKPLNLKQKRIKNFLKTIEMNESSGGKNTNHQRMKHGIHAGDAAIGNYGFMPNTVKEIVKQMRPGHPARKYMSMTNKDIEQHLAQKPDLQHEIATHLATKLYDKFKGDESKMAFSWNQGHNLQPVHFEEGNKASHYLDHDYVQKYQQNKGLTQKPSQINIASTQE